MKAKVGCDPEASVLARNDKEPDRAGYDQSRASAPGSLQEEDAGTHGGFVAAAVHDGAGAGSAHVAENDESRAGQDADGVGDRCGSSMPRVPSHSHWVNTAHCKARHRDRSRNSRKGRVHDGSGDAYRPHIEFQSMHFISCAGLSTILR